MDNGVRHRDILRERYWVDLQRRRVAVVERRRREGGVVGGIVAAVGRHGPVVVGRGGVVGVGVPRGVGD